MNFQSLLDAGMIKPVSSDEKVAIIEVNPDLASFLLKLNFKENRKQSADYINRLSSDMRDGFWGLSNDAIVVDVSGRIINAQHRLEAVVKSGTTQKFILLWDVARETAEAIDVGKKRAMHERITISGTRISLKECAVIRNAMNDYSSVALGTSQYYRTRHDSVVESIYKKHSDFMQALGTDSMSSGSSFFHAAALKMFVEMIHGNFNSNNAQHDQPAFVRAQLFLDLCLYGYSKKGLPTTFNDHAALRLKEMRDNRKVDYKGMRWSDKDAYRFTVCAAHKFMNGEPVKKLTRLKADPFLPFISAPPTNGYWDPSVYA
tara:strand:+ start:290 stop:1240 length:951 start_codon:yes stop_codon:yes gene_type:complete